MPRKAKGNTPVAFAPPVANQLVDLLGAQQGKQLGGGVPATKTQTDRSIVQLRNDTGSDLARGSVVDIGEMILTYGTSDPFNIDYPWFEGVEQDGGFWAVAVGGVEEDKIGPFQIAGRAIARVNVTNLDHRRAFPKIGQDYFESSHLGPVEILQLTDTGNTGVQECWCVLRSPQGTVRGITVDTLSHATAGTVNLVKLRSGTYSYQRNSTGAHLTVEAFAFVLNSADTIAANTAVTLSMDEAGNINADNANCEASDWLNELDTTAGTPGELAGGQAAAAQLPPDNNAAAADALAGNQDFGAIGGPNLWQV